MGPLGQHPPSPVPYAIQNCFVSCKWQRRTILESVSSYKQWVVRIYTLWLERQFSPHQILSFFQISQRTLSMINHGKAAFLFATMQPQCRTLILPSISITVSNTLLMFFCWARMAVPNRMNFWKSSKGRGVIFYPKIHIADFGPLGLFSGVCNIIFRKWGGGVKGRLEFLRKFLRFGSGIHPLVVILWQLSPSEISQTATALPISSNKC